MDKAEFLKKWFPNALECSYLTSSEADLNALIEWAKQQKEEEKPLNPLQKFLNYWTEKLYNGYNDIEFSFQTRELVAWAREEGAREYRDRMSEGKVLESNANDVGSDGTFWIPTSRLRYVRYNVKEVLQQEWKNLGGYPNIKKEWRDVPNDYQP